MKKKRETATILLGIVAVLFCGMSYWLGSCAKDKALDEIMNAVKPGTKATILIDAGHGGFDPGKVGMQGTLEKDINLSIALKLEKYMLENGYKVVMTRTEDEALCEGHESSKKMADMQNRIGILEESNPVLAVSIHQNSYNTTTKGAQVFYYTKSEDGEKLAKMVQNQLRELAMPENHRQEKSNDSYYMLKKSNCPFVIVECGFLSNPEEEALLKEEEYQEKIVRGIGEGIEKYLYGE